MLLVTARAPTLAPFSLSPPTLQPHGPSSQLSQGHHTRHFCSSHGHSLLLLTLCPVQGFPQSGAVFLPRCPLLRTGVSVPQSHVFQVGTCSVEPQKGSMHVSEQAVPCVPPRSSGLASGATASGTAPRDQLDTPLPSTVCTPLCVVLRPLNSLQRTGLQTAWGRQVSRPGEAHPCPAGHH